MSRIQDRKPLQEDEIDLTVTWHIIKNGKWLILSLTTISFVSSLLYAMWLPDVYRSAAVLAPAESVSNGGGKLSSQLGGLANLAGINFGSGGMNKTAEALEILKGWPFIEDFILEQKIAPEVFSVKNWDTEKDLLIYDENVYDPKLKNWVRKSDGLNRAEPTSWELYQRFLEFLKVDEDKESGFITISIDYFSPKIAKKWVEAIVTKINIKLQTRDSELAERNILFLKKQIEGTPVSSMQSVFYDLIEEQTKILMLAKGSPEYVFKTINEAKVAQEKDKPNRLKIVIVNTSLGLVFSVLFCLILRRNLFCLER